MGQPVTLRDKLATLIAGKKDAAWPTWNPKIVYPFQLGTSDYYNVDGRQSAIIMACIAWLQRTFPESPVVLDKQASKGQWERVPTHAMTDLLDSPNRYYDGLLLEAATLADFKLTGNAYWLKLRAKASNVVELWWLPSSLVEPKWEGENYLDWYEYRPKGQAIKILPSEIVHFRDGLDLNNTRKGLSPLTSLFREVFTDQEAASMTATLLKNLGIPGVLITPKQESQIGQAAADKIKADFKQKFSGDKRGEPMVMASPTDVSVLGFNPQQMDLKALRRIPEERISAVLGIPAIVAGLGAGLDRSTYSNMAEARESAYESCVIPTQRLFSAVIKRQLLSDFESDTSKFRVVFDISEVRVLQEDEDKLAVRTSTMVNGGYLAVDDAQRMVGAPVDATQHVYLRSPLLVEVPAIGQKATLVEVPAIGQKATGLPELKLEHGSEEWKDWHWKRVDGRRSALWGPVASQVEKLYFVEGADTVQAIDQPGSNEHTLDRVQQAIEGRKEDWTRNLIAIDLSIMRDVAQDWLVAMGLPKAASGEVKLDPFEAFVSAWLRKHATTAITSILQTNFGDVKRILETGWAEGQSNKQMAEQIQQYYDDRSLWKAMRVARTEVATAAGYGQQAAAEASGVVKTKMWLSARDARVRESHQSIDGETVRLSEPFSNGLMFPGDPAGPPEEIIQCRCIALYDTGR